MRAEHNSCTALDVWLGECARRGLSKATRTKYREIVGPFLDQHGCKPPAEYTPEDCRRYLDRWIDSSQSTLALGHTGLNGFFEFCLGESWTDVSPMARIQRAKRKRPEDLDVVSVSAGDVDRLFAACEEWDELLCLSVLAYLGPRRSATARLRRSHVDLEAGTARFLEKGGKVVVKPLPDELAAIIRAADENGVWAQPSDYLIPNRWPTRNRERSAKVVYAIVKRVAERAGVEVHPHALRAAFAVQFDEQHPREIWALKELLGHARIETTLVYLRRKDRAKAMEAVRDLSWGASVFPPKAGLPPAGFEPAFGEQGLPEPLKRKLEALRARSKRGARDRS